VGTTELLNRVSPPRITVATALALPELRRGLPTVVAGGRSLDRSIRWVHAGEVPNIASLLRGGELLLTTGMGIAANPGRQRRFIAELVERNVAALAIELGETFCDRLPRPLVDSAERHGLPLIELRATVRFVGVTEAIHTEIVNHHYALLERADRLNMEFTQLMLQGGGILSVVRCLANRLDNPVFLEAPDGRLLARASPETASDDAEAVEVWRSARPNVGSCGASAEILGETALSAGRLIVLPTLSPLDAFAPLALERAATNIALAFLRSRQEEELMAAERGDLLSRLASGRTTSDAAAAQASAMGFPTSRDALLLPIAAHLKDETLEAARWTPALRDLEHLLAARRISALAGVEGTDGDLLVVLRMRDLGERADLAMRAARIIRERASRLSAADVVISVGAGGTWRSISDGLRDAIELAAVASQLPDQEWFDATSMMLDRLLWRLRGHEDVQRFVDRVLAPLLAHDRRRKHALLPTLETLCAHGGRKAETARALHLNRQALYGRIARLEQILGLDVSEPGTLLSLQFALAARRVSEAAPRPRRPPFGSTNDRLA
jgi:PucR family transcriptional regulator, purine catabolism regulatory protein